MAQQDYDAILERLQEDFISMNEWNGIPITKDNEEKLFDQYCATLSDLEDALDKALEK